jgi:hypothetical protein
MKLFNKKLKPSLVDKNIINEYMKQKFPDPVKIIHLPPKEPSDLQKLFTKIMYNILDFLYNYFFIFAILFGIIYYLYNRYRWYQKIKTLKEKEDKEKEIKESKEIKKYFDDILSEEKSINTNLHTKPNLINQPSLVQSAQPIQSNLVQTNQPSLVQPNKSFKYQQNEINYIPGKKMDKNIQNNNGFLNHLKQSLDTKVSQTSEMSRKIVAPNKTVRFVQDNFDAFGRNNINPKTGEFVAFNYDKNIFSSL